MGISLRHNIICTKGPGNSTLYKETFDKFDNYEYGEMWKLECNGDEVIPYALLVFSRYLFFHEVIFLFSCDFLKLIETKCAR